MHVSVMLAQSLEYLELRPSGVYVDATCGLGGHTSAIAARLSTGRVFSSDRDAESLALAETAAAEWRERIVFSRGEFSTLAARFAESGLPPASGLLADLGVSRYQLTDRDRGFSFQSDGPLDMRMDRASELTAADIVNFWSEKDLADLIYRLGEERRSRHIARAIVRARPVRSTLHLAEVVEQVAPRTSRIHPATRTFMALRLAVNSELDEVEALLGSIGSIVGPGGRVVVISFHSLEDRLVKQAFQRLAREGRARLVTKHVVVPDEAECSANPSARSAKLRSIEIA